MSIVGIDLGTTNSCVAIVNENGTVDIINNDIGNQTTPSIVSFKKNGDIVVGQDAKNQIVTNPKNTIFGIKRLIGYKIGDKQIEKEKETYPYKIVEGTDANEEKAVVQVSLPSGEVKECSPEEIDAYILTKLKNSANRKLAKPIAKAVITVPAYFSSSQRKSTKLAGEAAGLDVIEIISEPTAAAIAYSYKNVSADSKRNVFVFDFGGGTLDCTLMKVENNNYEVISTSGDTHLGGEDIDMALLRYAAEEFKNNTGIDIMSGDYSKERALLKLECEKVKIRLSAEGVSVEKIFLDNFVKGKALEVLIKKDMFEYLIDDIIDSLMIPLNEVFDEASKKLEMDVDPTEFVDDVIMVGGSSHIPKVVEVLKDFFGKDPIYGVNPDTAVAQGAAIYAKNLNAKEDVSNAKMPVDHSGEITLIDVIPLSLGVENHDKSLSVVLKNNTPVPTENTKVRITVCDNQKSMKFYIYEGQRKLAKENRLLGSFSINNLTQRPKGKTKANITFKITKENILEIKAKEIGGTSEGSLDIKYNFGDITEEEVQEIMKRAKEYETADEEIIRTNKAFNDFDDLIYEAKKSSAPEVAAIIESMKKWKSDNSEAHSRTIYAAIEKFKGQLKQYISV